MRNFDQLFALAAKRKGGADAVEALLPKIKTKAALRKITDDRWLAQMTRSVFQAGFNWKVIEHKWPGFEEVFEGFQPRRWALMSDNDLDRLLKDTRIIRNAQKILSVGGNARLLCELAEEYGSAARAFADWPDTDFVGLLGLLKTRGSRLGGKTSQFMMRLMGKDGFVLHRDVSSALMREGVVTKPPSSKRDLAAVQAAFNQWREQSGRPLAHISRVLSLTVDSPRG